MQSLLWIVSLATVTLLGVGAAGWLSQYPKHRKLAPLPAEWGLSARPVFSTVERRAYRLLREALPQHIVLAKLPLVRFCQPADPNLARYWYELLGNIRVTFAVCSANGRVLAAVDLEPDRGSPRRVVQIKKSVLGACGVRFLRCPVSHLPSIADLHSLVPASAAAAGSAQSAANSPPPAYQPRGSIPAAPVAQRSDRGSFWKDSTGFQDSFGNPRSRLDAFASSGFAAFRPLADPPRPVEPPDEGGGIVVNAPRRPR